ncbi:hypothetical protein GUJ93_ZPchr0337g7092 [Zizania palustris]|uniref:Uncharacterized protein n=1 Tax=Zizania palustris TaxID=103762 RepID=A0A8J5RGC9_ZIZPA|nr:hypothetical protein GUJ93_ZPchr0337g7092 [Zizania palustris]
MFQQGIGGSSGIGFAVIGKGCLKLRCYAIGDGLGGPENLNDPLKENNNGPVLQGLNGSGAFFRAIGAKITQETGDFFVSDAEGDPDKPTDGFSSVDEAISALHEGKTFMAASLLGLIEFRSRGQLVSMVHEFKLGVAPWTASSSGWCPATSGINSGRNLCRFPKCDDCCLQIIPTNRTGMIEYRAHPFRG